MLKFSWTSFCTLPVVFLALSACTPKYDWREVRGTDASFSVMLPAKPASFSRLINLDGQQVIMTMTAAEVDGVTYAVGTATLPDSEKARIALSSMKSGLIKNIAGTIKFEKSSENKSVGTTSIEIDAFGSSSINNNVQSMRLIANFVAKDKHVYQVVIVGPEKAVTRDAIDTFFPSFKLN